MTNRTHIIPQNITETWPVMMNSRKFAKLQKKYTQNLTRCRIFKSKSDACLKSRFKIWRVVKCWFKIWPDEKISIQYLTRRKNFNWKSCFLQKLFHSKPSFLKIIFPSCFLKTFLSSKSCFYKKLFPQICAFQNRT